MRTRSPDGSPLFILAHLLALVLLFGGFAPASPLAAQEAFSTPNIILSQPGDTLLTVAVRNGIPPDLLALENNIIHPLMPWTVAGTEIHFPHTADSFSHPPISSGHWITPLPGEPLSAAAVRSNLNPWTIAWSNCLDNPFRPLARERLFVPGLGPPMALLPSPLLGLHISPLPAAAGQAIQIRVWINGDNAVTGDFEGHPLAFFPEPGGASLVALLGLGGFVEPADYHLNLFFEDTREGTSTPGSWAGRVRTIDPDYGTEEIWLSEETQQYLDAAAIQAEQTRLNAIFALDLTEMQWTEPWILPLLGEYTITSQYGTRRSYNGGPARSYHEGVDFSGLAGRPVVAPTAGKVVLAEPLFVRGNAIILDHGMGVYSGYYHLSEIHVAPGQDVVPGQVLGSVGSTGLSTGSHLHWDVVVAGINIDGMAWQALTASW